MELFSQLTESKFNNYLFLRKGESQPDFLSKLN
jgi:hypothetical protein